MQLKNALIVSIGIGLITACATQQKPQLTTATTPAGETSQAVFTGKSAQELSTWNLSGALAAKGPKKSWSASLNWQQSGPSNYEMRLFGPLGSGSVIVTRHQNVVTYQDGSKKASSSNASQLLQQQTGVQLPVANLYYWVRGIPAPGAVEAVKHDTNKNLASFRQSGYTVTYSNYKNVKGIILPGNVHMAGHGIVAKLIIKRWAI